MSCHCSYDPISAIQILQNVTFVIAVRLLAERAGIPFTNSGLSKEALLKHQFAARVLEVHEVAAKYFIDKLHSKEGIKIRQYLKDREIKDSINSATTGDSKKLEKKLLASIKSTLEASEKYLIKEVRDNPAPFRSPD